MIIIDIILSIFFLLFLGFTILNIKKVINVEREFRGLIYNSVIFQFFLSLSMLIFAVLSIFIFFFYSWKLFLILLFISYGIENNLIVPAIEKTLESIIEKNIKK